jgi:hypothetical protein
MTLTGLYAGFMPNAREISPLIVKYLGDPPDGCE